MILESVGNGPLIWPSIEENEVTRPKKYSELSATEAIQADCDVKATNIILQGLPPEGETLCEFYLRFSLLLNSMNIYNMKLEQFQVNTKFLNALPLKWSKFVTNVKLVRDLHTTNVDQLHAYLGQHEFHANEVRLMHERNSDPLALVVTPMDHHISLNNTHILNLSILYPPNDFQSSVHHNVYTPSSSIPQVKYAPSVNQQTDFSQPDSGLIVLVFQKGDDPIVAINYMMSFLTTVVTSRYPPTNNQLRNSSNPRQQATINYGRVKVQPIQGRHTSLVAGTLRTYTSGASGNNSGKQKTVICYNCKGEGHMFDHRLKTLETNFSEFMQTNQFAKAISLILGIVDKYLDHRMNEAVKVDIIKEQVKEQVKVQVSKILPKIEKTVNEQLEAEVLTRSSNSSKTSHVVAADLSELELKKILIYIMESNKSIHRSDEQKNLYKALVDAYECDKLILDTYGDTITLKRSQNDKDKDEEPSAGSNRGSKRRRAEKEPESTTTSESAPAEEPMYTTQDLEEPTHQEFKTGATDDQPVEEASQHRHWFHKQAKSLTLDRAWNKTLSATHGRIQHWISNLAKNADSRTSFNKLIDTPVDFSASLQGKTNQLDWNNPKGQQYLHDLLEPLPLIPNSRGRRVIHFDHFINNDLEYLRGGASSRKYTNSVTKTKATNYGHIKWIEDLFYGFAVNRESARDVYSKCRIIAVIELQIIEWHNYKHLDWIIRVKDLQLGVESYQKNLNLIKLDTYRSDLKCKEAYIAYSNLRVFIYQNKDKQNRLMRIDELHMFSDGTLNDVRTALDDRLKGIRMQYLPQTIWRRTDKDRAIAMIQAIDKQLKTRMIMRSFKKFVGGRLYEGDF
nr:hypothetical protein [Tanacetum cinerariifolium]